MTTGAVTNALPEWSDLLARLQQHAHDGRIALRLADEARNVTYAQLLELAHSRAHEWNVEQSLIFLFLDTGLDSIVSLVAAYLSRATVALLDASLDPSLRAHLESLYTPALTWHPASGTHHNPGPGPTVHAGLKLLLSTSGSTGTPKWVRLSDRAVVSNAAAIATALRLSPEARPFLSLPIHYAFGLSVLNSHLWTGATLVQSSEGMLKAAFWEMLARENVSSFAAVPYSYQLMLQLRLEKKFPGTLTDLTQAGGRLAPEHVAKFEQIMKARGGRLWVMYGQTEATARITVLRPEELSNHIGSVGRPIPWGSIEILDEHDTLITQARTVGRVVYRGPNVMWGYAETAADLARGDELNGRLETGDLGFLDADGRLFITGRSKRISKVLGLRVNLDELEGLVAARGPTAVISDDQTLQFFCEWGTDDEHQQCLKELATRFHLHPSVFRFRRVEALPRLASGKIDYGALTS